MREMREIWFRAKRKDNGEWVYGDLIHRKIWSSEIYIIRVEDNGFESYIEYEVIPETVGQFTGLTDKNGKKIFEGDILKSHYDDLYPDDYCHELVVWKDNGWCIQEGHGYDGLGDDEVRKYSTVVGNVFDNPDLLEVR